MSEITRAVIGMPFDLAMGSEMSRRQFHGRAQALLVENDRLNAENKQLILLECYGGTAQAAINLLAERDQLKAENEAMVIALNEILRVTPMGVEAFDIAALVLGEMGVSKEAQP